MALYDYQGNVISVGGSGGGSPIEGKRIAMIGDSNTQYNTDTFKAYMEDTYGCTFTPLGQAGATWETTAGVDATDNNAVGRVNQIIAKADENKLITEYDMIVIMMGTNLTSMGAPTDPSSNVSTMCGAMRYCMEKLCYYGRRIPIGVIIPIRDVDSDPTTMPTEFQYIEQIAKECAVSTSLLRRLFIEKFQIPPIQYRMNMKMKRAMYLIESTNMTVSEIAESLSFFDAAYFCKVFRAYTGMTPTQYAKSKRI